MRLRGNRPALGSSSRRFGISALALWTISLAALAQGGPPLATDDPGTPGNRRWELNVAFTANRTREGHTYQVPLLDANYGVGPRVQLKVEVPWVRNSGNAEEAARRGVGNALVGVKWRFRDEENSHIAIAVYPQFRFRAPGDATDEDLAFLLPVSLQKNLGVVSANAEIGYVWHQEHPDEWFAAIAFGRSLGGGVELIGEAFASSERSPGGLRAVFHAGGRWEASPHFSLLFAAGRGVGPRESETLLDAYLGSQFRF